MRKVLTVLGLSLLSSLAACSSEPGADSGAAEAVPLPSFTVDASLAPRSKTIAGIDGGPERALGAISGPTGGQADFVLNELAVLTKDRARVEALAERWGGKIVKEVKLSGLAPESQVELPSYFLVSIDPSAANPAGMPEALRKLDAGARGAHRVSSQAALELLAAAAAEASQHAGDDDFHVAVNFMFEPSGIWEGTATEHASGAGRPYSPNPYTWSYLKHYRVLEAWEALSAAGKLENRVKMMVMDGGFAPNPDFPNQAEVRPGNNWRVPNPEQCGGSPCPWHATDVVTAAMGQLDNGYGGVGPAAPVAELIAVQSPSWDVFQIVNWLVQGVLDSLTKGPRVINISATAKIPGLFGFSVVPVDLVVTAVRGRFLGIQVGQGSLLFAAAGNHAEDVDHEDCFGFCWESDVYVPCELGDAMCVGGTTWNDPWTRDDGSNWGKQQRVRYKGLDSVGRVDNSIDFYAPYEVWSVPMPDGAGNATLGGTARTASGTSFSSPFAAGIAALVFAADPTLSADQVYQILVESADDDQEKLRLNALAAVKKALAKSNNPPQIRIVAPADGKSLPAGIQGVAFEAQVKDFEDKQDVTVEWTSDKEGQIGGGTAFTHEFKMLGAHAITATVRDKQGATTQATVNISLTNTPPTATILAPLSGATVFRGQLVTLQGEVVQNFMHLPCYWTTSSSFDTGFPLTSCSGAVVFGTNGSRTLTLMGKDSYGYSASSSVTITVVDPPANAPPSVAISVPTLEQSLFVGSLVTLSGTAIDPDGKTPITYEWRFQGDACPQEVTIATGASATWDTAQAAIQQVCGTQQAGGATIRLYATDPDSSTGVGSVHVYMAYNPN